MYPEDMKVISIRDSGLMFFQFPLFTHPLPPKMAKQHPKPFFCRVYEALKELHEVFHVAHLDVRLENICNNSGTGIRLIDLDRSEMSTRTVNMCQCMLLADTSVMYQVDSTWTLDRVDWKQMGIMVFAVMNGVKGTTYRTADPRPQTKFLTHLITNGEYREDLYDHWNPLQDIVFTSS